MLDRKVPRVDYEKLSSDRLGESSAVIRDRERQRVRFKGSDIMGFHRILKLARTIAAQAVSDVSDLCTWRQSQCAHLHFNARSAVHTCPGRKCRGVSRRRGNIG